MVILYEYPFNERTRTYLRLEHLFRRLNNLMHRADPIDHHFALHTLFEVLEVGSRSDLKSDILKDLDKHKQLYNSYRGNPHISEAALDQLIGQLDQCFEGLHEDQGKTGHSLTDNEWLMSIRSRIAIPGGTCEFDLPAYHDWLQLPVQQRQADLGRWSAELASLATPVHLLLQLLRDSGKPQKVMATQGQFQQNLPAGRTFQLLRLRIDPSLGLVPEISGNRLMYSVRLLERCSDTRGQPSPDKDAELEITLCQ